MKNPLLSIILPCYKGGHFIQGSIKTIEEKVSLFEKDFELVVVIDGFADDGYIKASALKKEYQSLEVVGYEKNRGKGYAIRYGFLHSNGEYIVFLDSDMDYDPSALAWFLKMIEEYDADLVIGNRKDKNSTFNYPLLRKIASRGFNIYINLLFPELKLRDSQAGIKLIRRDAAKILFQDLEKIDEANGFIFDICLIFLAKKLNLKVIEAPCIFDMQSSTIGMGQNFFKQAFRMGRETWKFRQKFQKGF